MLKQILSTVPQILIVARLTGGIITWCVEHLEKLCAGPDSFSTKSLPELRKTWVPIFFIAALIIGLVISALYVWLSGHWSVTTSLYLWLGVGLTVLFSIGAFVAISHKFPAGKAGISSIVAVNHLWA